MSTPLNTQAFDLQRAIINERSYFDPFYNATSQPLKQALAAGSVTWDTRLLIADLGDQPLILVTHQMVYHHIAQGETNGIPWLASFCLLCNSGTLFSSLVDGVPHQFWDGGFYNAMTLLTDTETKSLWNHMTGECLHGTLVGKHLTQLSTFRHTSVKQVLDTMPDAQIIVSRLDAEQQATADHYDAIRQQAQPQFSNNMLRTLGTDDLRLPRLDMGLGVVVGNTARYYPFMRVNAADNALIDTIEGQQLLVYVDPETNSLRALLTEATSLRWSREQLILDTGDYLADALLYTRTGTVMKQQHPTQWLVRWYGFALMFPGCEVYST
ncbi:MAG: DUF3179 domain-containing protein [Armatimonadetes bacterium]|nr:DUF3179 domain-containing protein [Anaerolineae bacterium]